MCVIHVRDVFLLCLLKEVFLLSPHMTLPLGPGLALAVTLPFGVQALYKSIYFSIAMTKHHDHGSFKRYLRLTVPCLESHGHWGGEGVGAGRHDGA